MVHACSCVRAPLGHTIVGVGVVTKVEDMVGAVDTGERVGTFASFVGFFEGTTPGERVGVTVGGRVNTTVGTAVAPTTGNNVGSSDGMYTGITVGDNTGLAERLPSNVDKLGAYDGLCEFVIVGASD